MSTILKALKKIEDESEPSDPSLTWPNVVQTNKQLEAVLRGRRKKRYLTFIGVCVVLVMTAAGFYTLRPADPVSSPDISPPVFPEKNSVDPETSPPQTSMKPVHAEKQKVPVDGPAVSSNNRNPSAESVIAALPVSSEPVKTPSLPVKTHSPPDVSSPPVTRPTTASANPVRERPGPKARRDARIDLQAIAWAPEPENSFAVINNRIFHEGQSFEGITILRIGKDEVVFREKGLEWREDFRIK